MVKLIDLINSLITSFFKWWDGRKEDLTPQTTPMSETPQNAPQAPKSPSPQPKPTPAPKPLLDVFLSEIQAMEGWWPGSNAYTHNNPGNLRCNPSNKANWNKLATGSEGGFCVFPNYKSGLQGLRNVTVAVCEGKSATYNNAAIHIGLKSCADMTLPQYFIVRDPANDGNDPVALAHRFAAKLGVDINTFKMRDLLV